MILTVVRKAETGLILTVFWGLSKPDNGWLVPLCLPVGGYLIIVARMRFDHFFGFVNDEYKRDMGIILFYRTYMFFRFPDGQWVAVAFFFKLF